MEKRSAIDGGFFHYREGVHLNELFLELDWFVRDVVMDLWSSSETREQYVAVCVCEL